MICSNVGSLIRTEVSRMGEKDGPAITNPIVEIDRTISGLSREIYNQVKIKVNIKGKTGLETMRKRVGLGHTRSNITKTKSSHSY